MAATQVVLETVRGRSLHFPKLIKAGRVRRLVFGAEGVQEFENDPDCHRTVIIIKSPLPYHLLSHFTNFSPTGVFEGLILQCRKEDPHRFCVMAILLFSSCSNRTHF
ncbi:Protein kinase domain-containing protein [Aphelenchoides besseyi]|nr:Protein kinase domain-containing protein [Aphelenchoides besseyi]KAI6222539.1 Protein kinase domain-containing protein [Aphelenchoides besseyi]